MGNYFPQYTKTIENQEIMANAISTRLETHIDLEATEEAAAESAAKKAETEAWIADELRKQQEAKLVLLDFLFHKILDSTTGLEPFFLALFISFQLSPEKSKTPCTARSFSLGPEGLEPSTHGL